MYQKTFDKYDKVLELLKAGSSVEEACKKIRMSLTSYYAVKNNKAAAATPTPTVITYTSATLPRAKPGPKPRGGFAATAPVAVVVYDAATLHALLSLR